MVVVDHKFSSLLASISMRNSGGHEFCLQVVPILTGYVEPNNNHRMRHDHVLLHSHNVADLVAEFVSTSFAVYGFNSGHFTNCFINEPLNVVMTAPYFAHKFT